MSGHLLFSLRKGFAKNAAGVSINDERLRTFLEDQAQRREL